MRGHGCPQAGQGVCGIAGPARQFRAVQILDGQSAPRVALARGDYTILRIHLRKNNLADVGARGLERPFAQLLRQPIEKAVNDTKDFFSGLLGVRNLEGQGARLGNGLQKETCRSPGGQAYLACLEHDVLPTPQPLKLGLRGIGLQMRRAALARSNQQ